MMTRQICHVRTLELGCIMSHRDMMRVLHDMALAYPHTLFFAPERFHDVPGRLDPAKLKDSGERPSRDLMTLHQSAERCFAALCDDQITFQRAPAIRMALRAPWPDEVGSNDTTLLRGEIWKNWSGHLAYDSDDPAFWRARGRLANMTIPAIEPRIVLSVKSNTNRWLLRPSPQQPNEKAHPPESFGEAREIDSLCQFAQILAWYNVDDPETAEFMASFKRAFNKQLTTRFAWYDPATGRFVDRYRGRYRQRIGRDLMAWLCHHPGVYESISCVLDDVPGLAGRLVGLGPAPDFKAEVFLEAGLPIDDIDGLTGEERDLLLRRHEKKVKATG